MESDKKELIELWFKYPGAGKKTKACAPYTKKATIFRERYGIDMFNDFLEEVSKEK